MLKDVLTVTKSHKRKHVDTGAAAVQSPDKRGRVDGKHADSAKDEDARHTSGGTEGTMACNGLHTAIVSHVTCAGMTQCSLLQDTVQSVARHNAVCCVLRRTDRNRREKR